MKKELTKGQKEELYGKIIMISTTIIVLVMAILMAFYCTAYEQRVAPTYPEDLDQMNISNMANIGDNLYCGKNLFKQFNQWNGVKYLTSNWEHDIININYLKPKTNYTFSAILDNFSYVNSVWLTITFNNKNIEIFNNDSTIGTVKVISFKTPAIINNAFLILGRSSLGNVKREYQYSNIMIEEGAIATAYEPYFTNADNMYVKPLTPNMNISSIVAQGLYVSNVALLPDVAKDKFIILDFKKEIFISHPQDYTIRLSITGYDFIPLVRGQNNKFKILIKEDNTEIYLQYFTPTLNNMPVNVTQSIKAHISLSEHIYPFDDIKAGADYNKGYDTGHDKGYTKGYNIGFTTSTNSWGDLFPNLFGGIAGFFKNMLDIQVFGTSLLGIIATFGAILIALSIIKMVTAK